MTINITIPENFKNSKVKDIIINILLNDKNKTLTQIHRSIKKQGINTSFQAVIKATKILIEQDILISNNKQYSINFDWIKKNKEFFDKLYKENLKHIKTEKINKNEDIVIYKVSSLFELDKLWWDLLMEWANKEEKNKINIWKGQHMWWLIPRIEDETHLRDFLDRKEIKSYFILENNNNLDKIAKDYYIKKKEKVKIIKQINDLDEEINIFGDNILRFKRPKEIKEKIKEIYKNKKIDIEKITSLFNKKTEIEVSLVKDRFISAKICEDLIKKFR